jgi:predicted AAA+ superfamily ATPase
MAISNHERVGRALKLLHEGLYPYFDREMTDVYTDKWPLRAASMLDKDSIAVQKLLNEDLYSFLKILCIEWKEVFQKTLGKVERNLVSECQDIRNSWAHKSNISTDDAYRALDTISRLLSAVSAPEADTIEKQKQEIMRLRYEDQSRRVSRQAAINPTEGMPLTGLQSWREVVTPHPDVASGRYQQAEFAADLWQVYLDEGSDEYRDPTEFFRRTYLTEGLKQLLTNALTRLSGNGGDPVIELQTNFGGGKTHAMLALYHLCFGLKASDLPGLEPVFTAANTENPPQNINTAVIVGNKISPGKVHEKTDGTKVHTIWGEIAWQLGRKEGYEMVRAADETSTNPGDALKDLFNRYAPCLILVDEWVAYGRQLHERADLPGGSFDTHFTFAQTLSESAKNANSTLLVVSIPSSDIEIGGDRGKEALDRLKNAIGRVESPWRPASAEESFEIVRRRLFQTMAEPELFVARDAVVRAFMEMYKAQGSEFPIECREAAYERRLREAYPIHPEFFDRLYTDWSTLDKFQRTRGVLRLMAKVIHSLWEREDKSLMILPAHIPMDDGQIQSELTRYLDDGWLPIIEKDVDGSNSLPMEIDRENPNFGRYSACRRVTRTIYLGSAPTSLAANRGLEDRRIKLGCVQPGESVATFGDALRRLTDRATYLYMDGNRYWISNQPNVSRTAQDRASQLLDGEEYKIWQEIVRRLKVDKQRGEFGAIHIAPDSSADIPDDSNLGVRLVILSPQQGHSKSDASSAARTLANEILHHRGTSPRYYKNTLIFLAPDKANLDTLTKNVAQYLAWESIVKDTESLDLNTSQTSQAKSKRDQSHKDVDMLVNEAYQWLIIPTQPDTQGNIEWIDNRIPGKDESSIIRASRKLISEGQIVSEYAGSLLRLELDKYLWRDKNHIELKQLWEYLAQYLYLPRFTASAVLLQAVKGGLMSLVPEENFAYAEGWNEDQQRYIGLVILKDINPSMNGQSLLVKTVVAREQKQAEKPDTPINYPSANLVTDPPTKVVNADILPSEEEDKPVVLQSVPLRRFHGSIEIDPLRMNRDADAIAKEVLQHLTRLKGATVKITLEIEAEVLDGVPDDVVRTVTENCNTLKFKTQGFERE